MTNDPEKPALKKGRGLRILLRTLHIIGFSVLVGGHWFGVPRAGLEPWLYFSVLSGAGLMLLELRGGPDWFLQLAGGLTLLKLLVLALVPVFREHSGALLLLAVVIGSAGSHMPASLRHLYYLHLHKS